MERSKFITIILDRIYDDILEIFLRRKDPCVKVSKEFHFASFETMRDVPILEIEAPAYVAGRYTTLVVKYRFRIVRLTLNLLKPAVTIYASRHYGFMPHIQYRCTIIRKHQRLSKAIAD